MAHILIVADERELADALAMSLGERGHTTQCACSSESALAAVDERRPDLVLLDLELGDIEGMETLRGLRARASGVPVVVMSGAGGVPAAVTAMKLGATDFLTKAINNHTLLETIETLLAMRAGAHEQTSRVLIGEGPCFRRAVDLAHKFAVPDISVLLFGETGTGKELFARSIHAASKRYRGPFVAVDCSALPEHLIESELFGHEKGAFTGATARRIGRWELAQGGTLFLDEVGNLPVAFQAKLLRVLQERCMERVGGRETISLDFRLISATNVDLKAATRAGQFRKDLYYRLNEMTICLPPLRDRDGDVRRLAEYFVRRYSARFAKPVRGLSGAALELLERHRWPGNIRELENTIKAAVVLADDVVLPEHLPPEVRGEMALATTSVQTSHSDDAERLRIEIEVGLRSQEIDLKALGARAAEQAERSLLAALVRRCPMSGAQMARVLGVDPKTLRVKLRKYGLEQGLLDAEELPPCSSVSR